MLTQSHKDHLCSMHVLGFLQLPSSYLSNCTALTSRVNSFCRAFFFTFMVKIVTD